MLRKILVLTLISICLNVISAERKEQAEQNYFELTPTNLKILKDNFNQVGLNVDSLHSIVLDYLTEYQSTKSFDDESLYSANMCALSDGNVALHFGKEIKIFDINHKCFKALTGHLDSVVCLCALPNNQLVSAGKTIKIWNIQTGECIQTLNGQPECINGHSAYISCLCALPNNEIATGAWDCEIKIWDIQTEKCLRTLKGHTTEIKSLCIMNDNTLVSVDFNNTVLIWDIQTGECLQKITLCASSKICALPNYQLASVLGKYIEIWNLHTGECSAILEGHNADIGALCLISNKLLVSGADNGTIRIWDITSGKCLYVLNGYKKSVASLCTLANGILVSVGYEEEDLNGKKIKIWEPCNIDSDLQTDFLNYTF